MANQEIHSLVSTLNSNFPKYAYGTVVTDSIAPDNSGNASIPLPSGATAIKAVIPYGETPASHWTSRLIFVQADNTAIYYRCIGTGASQSFTIRYVVIYV